MKKPDHSPFVLRLDAVSREQETEIETSAPVSSAEAEEALLFDLDAFLGHRRLRYARPTLTLMLVASLTLYPFFPVRADVATSTSATDASASSTPAVAPVDATSTATSTASTTTPVLVATATSSAPVAAAPVPAATSTAATTSAATVLSDTASSTPAAATSTATTTPTAPVASTTPVVTLPVMSSEPVTQVIVPILPAVPPAIKVNGANPAAVDVGSTYSDWGATITGPLADLNLGISASVDGATSTTLDAIRVDTSAAGTHTIVYSVTDQAGLTGTASRTVNVIDLTAPVASSTATSTATTTPAAPSATSTPVSAAPAAPTPVAASDLSSGTGVVLGTSTALASTFAVATTTTAALESSPQCIKLDSVGYYCIDQGASAASTEGAPTSTTTGPTVYAERAGTTGTMQVFLKKDDAAKQLSAGIDDSMFPAMDPDGGSVVWQQQIDGRWQIMYYDLASAKAIAIPSPASNNMQPQVFGSRIVWQGWTDDNWEIYLADLSQSDASTTFSVRRITANTVNDMFPVIAGDLISWQSYESGSWHIFTYNVATGELSQVTQGDGKFENPRFALVWDSRDESGSSTVYARDLGSGKVSPLTPPPAPSPASSLPDTPIKDTSAALLGGSASTTQKEASSTPES